MVKRRRKTHSVRGVADWVEIADCWREWTAEKICRELLAAQEQRTQDSWPLRFWSRGRGGRSEAWEALIERQTEAHRQWVQRLIRRDRQMTVDEVNERLEQIRREAVMDDEEAHIQEDALRRDVLVAIAQGAPNGKELAQAALLSSNIKFARYCA